MISLTMLAVLKVHLNKIYRKMKNLKTFVILATWCFISIFFCSADNVDVTLTIESPNILLIIEDDLGKDAINGYAERNIKPNTPYIDAIKNIGITFNNLRVYPTCTPTRASIITGKYGYRTGVKWAGDELPLSEETLQKYISDNTNDKYTSGLIGKWHLSGFYIWVCVWWSSNFL